MEITEISEPEELGYTKEEAVNAVFHSKDLRSRYIFTSLCSDLGIFSKNIVEKMVEE